jgi:hypothetical protein
MKSKFYFPFLLLFQCFLYSCSNDTRKEQGKSENNIDAARNFIRAALDGKFDEARTYMITDTVNTQYLDAVERNYRKMGKDTIDSYRGATIRIYSPVRELNDSVTIIMYSNSFMNDRDTLKLVKVGGQWKVDLKYLFEHDSDSIQVIRNPTDSLK